MLKLMRQINKFNTYYKNVPFPATINKIQFSSHQNHPKFQDDKEYLVRVRADPDVFGPSPLIQEKTHELDAKEEKHISNERQIGRKLSTKQYADIIKSLINKKQIKEAIDVVEVRMLKEDRVQPENYIYNLLIGACGRVGYTKKAFQLYNEIKRRGMKIHPGTYTALFNACANSPWTEDGLQRAKHLHNIMVEAKYEPNDSNYHAMIKAYGRCGDINAAFALVDEMFSRRMCIKDDTLNFLLQACISDKEAGFRHALLTWRKFMRKHISPSVYSYNLLLRVTRDCGLGDLEVTKDALKQILPSNDKFLRIGNETNTLQLESGDIENGRGVEIQGGNLPPESFIENRPNLLAPTPHLGDIIHLNEITKAEDRLLLLGGAKNVLEDMASRDIIPDIKTYTQLLDCLPSTLTAENELMAAMKKNKVHADLDFYNMLIKKRSMRFDYVGAKEVLSMMKKSQLPNIITYGILALGCKTKEEAENFLYEMQEARYRINAEILGAMLQQSTYHMDFAYVMFVMEQCVSENIQPNEKFMEHLRNFTKKCKKYSNDYTSTLGSTKKFQKGYRIFKLRMKSWLTQVTPEETFHPWKQYREPVTTDIRHFKDPEKGSRFKARHKSLFRKKTAVTTPIEKDQKSWRHKRSFQKLKPE